MLQRAASNAYSWWWASHIRTKQSKWLEENLHGMEDRVTAMLKIIENTGDTFAQRVEMYYRKRPELVNHVEESYRAYRALAERYDHLSKELQSANRTIANVFPDQVQFLDDDGDENSSMTTVSDKEFETMPKTNLPPAPMMPKKDFRSPSISSTEEQQLNRNASSAKAASCPCSGLTKEQALDEIDKLHKEILTLQTEREFVQSVFERCQAKCNEIDDQITDTHARVSSIKDEFGIDNVIDDNEARTLMAARALKSCQDALVRLQEKQERSIEEAKVEKQRIDEANRKFKTIKGLLSNEEDAIDGEEPEAEDGYHHDLESLKEQIKKELEAESKSSFTAMQLAEMIDELVEKVVNLETQVSSQNALVNRLRSETDGLQDHVKSLEEDKESLLENSHNVNNKLKELEEEIRNIKILNKNINCQHKDLETHFAEASCNIDHLSEKLQNVKPDEEVDDDQLTQEEIRDTDTRNPDANRVEEHGRKLARNNAFISKSAKIEEDEEAKNSVEAQLPPSQNNKEKDLSEIDEMMTDEEDSQPNWRQMFISGAQDREKLLLEEYTLVVQNYKDVRKKLGEVEKKNRDGFFELALQIRELKNAVAEKDEEIHSLRAAGSEEKHHDANHNRHLVTRQGSPESMTQVPSFLQSNVSSLGSPHPSVFDPLHEHHFDTIGRIHELAASGDVNRHNEVGLRNKPPLKRQNQSHQASAIEEKIRSDIDDLLEENLEFWLRFSTSFHQIRKFQTTVHDLRVELLKLKEKDKYKGESSGRIPHLTSEVRPIYQHLREIQTELALWLENNSVLKDEIKGRFASLCNIQDELSRLSSAGSKAEQPELSEYQAAKFLGEVLNMKQESNKVAEELKTGLDHVTLMKAEVEKILSKLDEEFGVAVSVQRNASNKPRIPLRSFLFGVKLKNKKHQKPSLFSCATPALQKQYSDMVAAGKLPT